MTATEFAGAGRGLSPYEGLALRTGRPLHEIMQLATQDRLGELFDHRGFVGRPLTGSEALRRLEKIRYAPGDKPRSPAELIGELRARRTITELREQDIEERWLDPNWRLAEVYAKAVPPWLLED